MREEIEMMKNELNELKEESFGLSLLHDYKTQNKRLFVMWLITFIALVSVSCYLVYILNDIEVEKIVTETTEAYEIEQNSGDEGNNNFINGNGNEVNNG